MLSASLGAAPPRGAQAHTASIAVVLDDDNDDNDDNAVGVGLALPGTARSVYRHAGAVANERPHTSRRVTFAAPSTQPTPLPAPMPQPLSVAPPMLPMAELREPAAPPSATPTDESDKPGESDNPGESDGSDGFSYSSESSGDDDDDNVIGLSAGNAARLSGPLNEAFSAADTTLVWPDWIRASNYVRDVEARRSKLLYLVPGSNSNHRVLRCASGIAPGVIKPRPRGSRNASGAEIRPAHQADASASEVTPAALPILLAATAPIADNSDPFGGMFSNEAWRTEELTPSADEARQEKLFMTIITPATDLKPPEEVVANQTKCRVGYRLSKRKTGWSIKVEGHEHSASCASGCRVGYKRIAAIEQVQIIVQGRKPKCDKQDLARQIASHLPHGQLVDHVLCSRVVRWCDRQADLKERSEYGLIAPWALRATALNRGLVVVLGVKITGTGSVVDFWRRWSHDPAQPDNVRHESEWPRGPLDLADAAVFDYVVLINPAARGLSSVMQNIISLDGTSARRFGQVLLVESRINGHNVALAAILGRTENGLNYSRLLRHLFNVVPEMAARPPTVMSDRGAAIIAAVEAFEPEMRTIAQKLWTERFDKKQAQRAPGEEEQNKALFINRVVLEASKLQLHHINCLPHLLRNIHKHFSGVDDECLWKLFLELKVDEYDRVLCAVDEAAKPKRAVGPQSLSAYLASSHGAGATKGPAA